jgi:hypothetical protein
MLPRALRGAGDVHDYIPLIVDRADHGDYTYVSSLLHAADAGRGRRRG